MSHHPPPQGFPPHPSHPSEAHTSHLPQSYNSSYPYSHSPFPPPSTSHSSSSHSPFPPPSTSHSSSSHAAFGHAPLPPSHSSSSYAPPTVHHPPPCRSHSLPPRPPTLVNLLGSQYVLPYETTLVLREDSRRDMDVTDVTGVLHFKSRAIKSHKNRAISDSSGRAICSTMMTKKICRNNTTLICLGGDPKESKKIAKVKKVEPSQAHVFFNGNKSPIPDIKINGSFGEAAFLIVNSGEHTLAEVTRDYALPEVIQYGRDTYYLRIVPGVDMLLMVVLVTIIEDVFVGPTQ